MASGRVPRFTLPVDGRELTWEHRPLGRVFTRSPQERAVAFIASMDHGSCRGQVQVITEVVRAAAADGLTGETRRLRLVPEPDLAAH
jgi:hypothetical protein